MVKKNFKNSGESAKTLKNLIIKSFISLFLNREKAKRFIDVIFTKTHV